MKTNKLKTIHIVAVTAGWIGLALIKNGFDVLVETILEYDNRRNWRNRNRVLLNQGK